MPGKPPHDHDHSHAHDEEVEDGELDGEEEEDDLVVLEDAEGNEREFHFLAVVELDEESYALLTPAEEQADEEAPAEVFIFHYVVGEEGDESFSHIEDEALFARVQAEAEALFAEMDDEDEE